MAVGECTYCLTPAELTADHVPPKVLLAKPYPTNYPTVPSCVECNRSFQKDDDYTASVIPMDIRALSNPVARQRVLTVIRSMGRPNAAGFIAYLARQRSPSRVLGATGEPLGALVDVDRSRVDATVRHIVRGLFRYEAKRSLPLSADILVGGTPGFDPNDSVFRQFQRIYETWPERRSGEVGPGFSYATSYGHGYSVWFLLLYGYFPWIVFVSENEPLPRP